MAKGTYVDGFVLVVPKGKAAEYKKMAEVGKKLWRKYGALDYKECMGDDLNVPDMKGKKKNLFGKLVRLKPGETVWFSYIVYKNKAHRDAVNKKVMSDPMMSDPEWMSKSMPMDMKRFYMGGFKIAVSS